ARTRAGLGRIARADRSAADGSRVADRVLARQARPIALIERAGIAVVGAGRPVRLEGVRRAEIARPRAGLGGIAIPRHGAADGPRGTPPTARAGRARSRAGLGRIAPTCRRATHGAGIADRVLATDIRPVTPVGGAGVAVVRAGRSARLDRVGRTRGRG